MPAILEKGTLVRTYSGKIGKVDTLYLDTYVLVEFHEESKNGNPEEKVLMLFSRDAIEPLNGHPPE